MSENRGALITPRLTAKIHHALGRAAASSSTQGILIGEELCAEVQSELEDAFRRGSRSVPSVSVGSAGAPGGGSGTYRGGSGAYRTPEDIVNRSSDGTDGL
jgi:hypothetical protein